MSTISRRTKSSGLSSILKAPSLRDRLSGGDNNKSAKVTFSLPHSKRIKNILTSFLNKENVRDYENLVCIIRDAVMPDSEIKTLLKEISECVPLINQELKLLLEAVVTMKWNNRSDAVVSQYQSFLVNLLSAHNYHARVVINKLITNFLPDVDSKEWPNGSPTDEDCKCCINVHTVLRKLLNGVPMCRDFLMHYITLHYPYNTKPAHWHEYYLHNLLWIIEYEPKFRSEILQLVFSKLIVLDTNSPRAEIERAEYDGFDDLFEMDEDMYSDTTDKMRHSKAHILDVCLDKIFNFFAMECHNPRTGDLVWEKAKNLYHDMVVIFEKGILTTYDTHHVQFVMFYLCSFKPSIAEAYLNYLWKKICTPNIPVVQRQSAAAFIASLVARSNFIPLGMVKGTLQQMAGWIHSYILTQDGLECLNSDVRVHAVFYSVCQGLFYVIAFRHRDLFSTKKNIVFLETLNLPKVVTCPLNPLRVCQPAVVQNFAAVTRAHQLAYCYAVIEHNARNVLPTVYKDEKGSLITADNLVADFFPFDPYILKRSRTKIDPIYCDYVEHSLEEEPSPEIKESGDVEIDDFLPEQITEVGSPCKTSKFSYGSSPGFKFKM